ncbi:MAG: hypothetical protein HYU46_12075, partial [Deltaproteobacteria bacterium]|nr:hypothetical protein [Deltaproteobacteria bacterium]
MGAATPEIEVIIGVLQWHAGPLDLRDRMGNFLKRHVLNWIILSVHDEHSVVAFTAAVTLEELGIAPELVRSAFVILFGAVALALALAFG